MSQRPSVPSRRAFPPSRPRPVACITGITGQDGSYLAELLLGKGYRVHGLVRRTSSESLQRIAHLLTRDVVLGERAESDADADALTLHYGDLSDGASLRRFVRAARPTEIYNLAAQSHVALSFGQPEHTSDVNGLGVVRLLEVAREYAAESGVAVRFYQAGSSEMFGTSAPPQSEHTPFHPRSPYACSKAFAHHQTVNYRESYGLFAVNGILFNHESPRRGESFVTRKITRAAARIHHGLQRELRVGRLDVARDWGFAGDYVDAMWRMLQQDEPDDFVIATGVATSLEEFLTLAFERVDLDWRRYVIVDDSLRRPADVSRMQGDAGKARDLLGWRPTTTLESLVEQMIARDRELAERELAATVAPTSTAPRQA